MDAKKQIVSVGLEAQAPRRLAPKGLARLFTYATGKDILVVGPSGAGKTKFGEYLKWGILSQEDTREMTYHVTQSATFVIQIGEGGFTLKVRRAVDTPGQTGPIDHAGMVGQRKPHAVVVVLDCSKEPATLLRWLHLFCDRLDTVLRKSSAVQKRLGGMLILLNKRDKITRRKFNRLRGEIEEVLLEHLSVVMGADRVHSIPILECISVETRRGVTMIDTVIGHLMGQLAG
jgi:signal recognition particle receptor subunit beta